LRGTADTTHKMSNKTERPRARVFLVDDHALVRKHLTALIAGEPDLAVCGEAVDVPTALALIQQQGPDLVILDLTLKGSSGLDLLDALKGRQPRPAVLVLSVHEEAFYVKRALEAGALGYLTKEEATVEILTAIRRVLGGQPYVSRRMAEPGAELGVRGRRGVLQEART
jgi:DNA-binding NarL/FixJ family response regulator